MRTQAEWDKRHYLMGVAKVLADFARLELDDGVGRFRSDNPNFVPANWWAASKWIRERDLLRIAWKAEFPAELTLKLTTSHLFGEAHLLASAGIPADIPNPYFAAHMITEALDSVEGRTLMGRAPNPRILAPDRTDITAEVKKKVESGAQVWPYQRAVLFLHIHPKQARICYLCEKPFVSESSNAQYCQNVRDAEDGTETTCARAHRKHYKHDNWSDNSDSINERRRRDYAAANAAKKKPKKTAR